MSAATIGTESGEIEPQESQRLRHEEPDGSLRGTVFNYMNTIIGSGTLALPYNFYLDGAIVGVAMLCLVAFLAERTAKMLLYATDATSGRSYNEIGTRAFNSPKAGIVIDTTIAVLTFGIMTSYIVLCGDLIPEVLRDLGALGWLADRRFVCIVVSAVILFPLSCLPSMKPLGYTSFLSIACVTSFVVVIIVESAMKLAEPDNPRYTVPADETGLRLVGDRAVDFLNTVPVIFFAYIAHQNIPLLYRELRHKTRSSAVRAESTQAATQARIIAAKKDRAVHAADLLVPLTPSTPHLSEVMNHGGVLPAEKVSKWEHKRAKMLTAIRVSLFACTMVYSLTALSGYALFRGTVEPDVLLNFTETKYPFIPFIKAAYCLVIVFSFPVMSFGCRESFHQLVFGAKPEDDDLDAEPLLAMDGSVEGGSVGYGAAAAASSLSVDASQSRAGWRRRLGDSWWIRYPEALLLIVGACALGLAIPNIQIVFEFSGAVGAVNVMYTFPALLYIRVVRKEAADRAAALGKPGPTPWTLDQLGAVFMLVLGVVICVASTTSIIYTLIHPPAK